jgi:dihydrofolate reductase
MKVGMIWAQSQQGVIGNQGKLPWRLPEDLMHFRAVTDGCPVIMGRKTNESLPGPLHGRVPITITSDPFYFPKHGGLLVPTLRHALDSAMMFRSEWAWIIGGGEILKAAIEQDVADLAIVTTIRVKDGASIIQGDVLAPRFEPSDWTAKAFRPDNGGWFPSRTPELEWRVTEMERKRA